MNRTLAYCSKSVKLFTNRTRCNHNIWTSDWVAFPDVWYPFVLYMLAVMAYSV